MIRIKHITADGKISKNIDLTPESTAADVKAAHVAIDGLLAEDKTSGNTVGIVAKPVPPKEEGAA